jgi:hypothetical protein
MLSIIPNILTSRIRTKKINSNNITDNIGTLSINNTSISNLSSLQYKSNIVRSDRSYTRLSKNTLSNKLFISPSNGLKLKIDKDIAAGTIYNFDIIESGNVSFASTKIFDKIDTTFKTLLSINNNIFNNENNVTINFEINMKYVGLFSSCNNYENCIINGFFIINKDILGNYTIVRRSIVDIDYNPNDLCYNSENLDSYLSPYFLYDVPNYLENELGLDTENESSKNIYDTIDEMLKLITLIPTNNKLDIYFELDNFYGKIIDPIISFNYRNTQYVSPLIFTFYENYDVVVTRNSSKGLVRIPINESTLSLNYLVRGDKIQIEFIAFRIISMVITSTNV